LLKQNEADNIKNINIKNVKAIGISKSRVMKKIKLYLIKNGP
jgi:hypothetical protein